MKKMYEKTIAKQILKKVTLDPDKVNGVMDSFDRIETEELNYNASTAQEEINENMCTGEVIDIDYTPVEDEDSSANITEPLLMENIGSNSKVDKAAELMNAREEKRKEFGLDDVEQEQLPWE